MLVGDTVQSIACTIGAHGSDTLTPTQTSSISLTQRREERTICAQAQRWGRPEPLGWVPSAQKMRTEAMDAVGVDKSDHVGS